MAVTLQACFEIDLPTSTLETLQKSLHMPPDGTAYKLHTSAKAFCQQHPVLLPYLVRNGWLSDGGDLVLIVTQDEKVDQPVA